MKLENVQHLQELLAMPDLAVHEPVLLAARIEIGARQIAPSGEPYRCVGLFDSSGHVPAYALKRDWDGHALRSGDLRNVALQTMDTDRGRRIVVIYPEYGEPLPSRHPLDLLPIHRVIQPAHVQRLIDLVEGFTTPSYQAFAAQVFEDPHFAIQFVTQPASRRCHHAYASGLLVHSVELAEAVTAAGTALRLPALQVEAGALLALFHDVGKLLLSEPTTGPFIPTDAHEELIEYALMEPLGSLRKSDPDAYHALWSLVVAYRTGKTYPAPLAGVVRDLDGCSAQADAIECRVRNGTRGQRVKLCGRREVWVPPPSRQAQRPART